MGFWLTTLAFALVGLAGSLAVPGFFDKGPSTNRQAFLPPPSSLLLLNSPSPHTFSLIRSPLPKAARHAHYHHRHLLLAPVSKRSASPADVCAIAKAEGWPRCPFLVLHDRASPSTGPLSHLCRMHAWCRWAIVYMAHMYPLVVPILEPEKDG
eukprot:SM000078S22126  [mRNA]  locus=s78:549758:550458:+ [translate_table: standard]